MIGAEAIQSGRREGKGGREVRALACKNSREP